MHCRGCSGPNNLFISTPPRHHTVATVLFIHQAKGPAIVLSLSRKQFFIIHLPRDLMPGTCPVLRAGNASSKPSFGGRSGSDVHGVYRKYITSIVLAFL